MLMVLVEGQELMIKARVEDINKFVMLKYGGEFGRWIHSKFGSSRPVAFMKYRLLWGKCAHALFINVFVCFHKTIGASG